MRGKLSACGSEIRPERVKGRLLLLQGLLFSRLIKAGILSANMTWVNIRFMGVGGVPSNGPSAQYLHPMKFSVNLMSSINCTEDGGTILCSLRYAW